MNKFWKNEPYPINLLGEAFGEETLNSILPLTRDVNVGLQFALSTLDEREEKVLEFRYKYRKNMEEVANELSLTDNRIRQIEAKAFRKLRHPVRYFYITKGMLEHMNEMFDSFYEEGYRDGQISAKNKLTGELPKIGIYSMEITDLHLTVRSYNCLMRAGITTVGECINCNNPLRIRNLGIRSVYEIANILESLGLNDTAWSETKSKHPLI